MVLEEVAEQILNVYDSFVSFTPTGFQSFASLFFIVIMMVVYSVVVWKLHKFIGTKNILELNLNQYNTSKHPSLFKIIAFLFYVLEYLILMPILILLWFALFSIFMILVLDLELQVILFVSAAIVATIRIIAYIPHYGGSLGREVAKLLPLTLLAIALLTPEFFDMPRIIGNISKLGGLFKVIVGSSRS